MLQRLQVPFLKYCSIVSLLMLGR